MKNFSNSSSHTPKNGKVDTRLLEKSVAIIVEYFEDIDPAKIRDLRVVMDGEYYCFQVGEDESLYSCPTKPLAQSLNEVTSLRSREYEYDPDIDAVVKYSRREVTKILQPQTQLSQRDLILTDLHFQRVFGFFYPKYSLSKIQEISLKNHVYQFVYQGVHCICPENVCR